MRWLIAVLALASTALAAPTTSAFSDDPIAPCTAENSEPVTLEEAARRSIADDNRCVTVTALASWNGSDGMLHTDVEDSYFDRRDWRSNVYFTGGPSGYAFSPWHPMPIEAHGRPRLCQNPVGFVFPHNMCFDPLIDLDTFKFVGPPAYRLTGDEARERVGNLRIASAEWEHLTEAAEAFRTWWLGLAPDTLAPDCELSIVEECRDETFRAVFQEFSGFAEHLAVEGDIPAFTLFVVDTPVDADGQLAYQGWEAVACICTAKSCQDVWPISTLDVDNDPTRPYVCAYVGAPDGEPTWVSAPYDRHGLIEPPKSARRFP